MFLNIRKSRPCKIVLILCLSSILLLGACTSAPTTGWSGPIIGDGVLYVGSIQGKVIALSNVTGTSPDLAWEKEFETQPSGSLFACGAQMSTPMSTYGVPAIGGGPGDEKLYVGGYDGNIYSIRIDDRSMSGYDTDSAIVGSPVVADDLVFVGNSDGDLYCLDLQLGFRWVFETGDKIWSSAEVDNGVVYIGSADHNLYAIDIQTGSEIWRFTARGAILSTPLVADGTVYVGSCDDYFYAVDAATGNEKWSFKAENWFWTEALLYDGEIWVGSLDHKLYVFNAVTGEKVWEYRTGGMIQSPPVLIGDTIVVGSGSDEGEERGKLYKIDPQGRSAREFYSFKAPVLAPLYADSVNGIVFVHAQDGTHTLYAITVEDGRMLWSRLTSE